ncbi:MAG: 3-phenylpropionate MFS transporter [Alphaproteobacteria bacterium]|nr:3-phenylpropionate MFS transporter [Alphaproteobacteria bacterium]
MPSTLTIRYAGFYGGFFLTAGILLPFWPLWLESRGLGAVQIGILLALGPWVRVLTNPLVAQIADRSGRAKAVLVIFAGLSVLAFAGFIPAQGFWWIAAISLLATICLPAMLPIGESQVMAAVLRHKLDYGRIRLWGSITFIVGTLGAGRLLTGRDPDLILLLILAALALTFVAAVWFPQQSSETDKAERGGVATLLRQPRFVLFVVTASLLQASHAVLNGFSSLHWRAAGISETFIGGLWAEGVIAEVLLFSVSGFFVARLGPVGLLTLAGIAGVVRWTVLAQTTDLATLAIVQVLHGVTFGAVHLAAMHFVARNAPPGLSATAQGIYASMTGLAMGLAMIGAGRIFAAFDGKAFFAMAVISAIGTVMALLLWLQERK